MGEKERITLTIEEDLAELVDEVADSRNVARSDLINELISISIPEKVDDDEEIESTIRVTKRALHEAKSNLESAKARKSKAEEQIKRNERKVSELEEKLDQLKEFE